MYGPIYIKYSEYTNLYIQRESKLVVARATGYKGWGTIAKGYGISFGGD